MHNLDFDRVIKRLVNDTIPLCQTEQLRELLFARVGVQIEVQSNLLEPNDHIYSKGLPCKKWT
jgi:hypothetical protein